MDKVSQMLENGCWNLPESIIQLHPQLAEEIMEVEIGTEEKDTVVWMGSADGIITMKKAFDHYIEKGTTIAWQKKLWRCFLPPQNFSSGVENLPTQSG